MKRSNKLLKILDYYLGSFLVFLLGLIKIKRKIPKKIKTIGLLKPVAIGDLTLLSAIVKDIKKTYSLTEIVFFVGLDNYILVPYISGIDKYEIINIKKKPIKAIKKIRKYELDILIDFCSWPRINSIMCFFAKSKYIVGFKTKRQNRHYIYDKYIEHKQDIHELDNYKNLLKPLNIQTRSFPNLCVNFQKKIKQTYCIFHLAAGGNNNRYRQWPFDNWKNIAEFLLSKNYTIYLTGSLLDEEINVRFINFCSMPNIHNYAKKDFSKTINLIKNSKFVISVNTGMMHVAAALNIPTISLNGPTNIKRWGAVGNNVYNMKPNVDNCGFLNLGFEYKNQRTDCMLYVYAQDVKDRINKII